jgi:uncharacterized SAM-binding protein YcdF (DUF218 family)
MKAFLKLTLLFLLSAIAIAGTIYLSLGYLISYYADEPQKADVIIVLGGDDGLRVDKGAELYNCGYAPTILLTGIDKKYYDPDHPNWRELRLIELGVPKKAIRVDTGSKTSWEEAVNGAAIMNKSNWDRALIVSDPPHMYRLHQTWSKALEGSSKQFILVSTKPDWWEPALWWNNTTSYRFVISEIKKNLFYAVVYY